MSTITEKRSVELMISLINKMDSLDKPSASDEEPLGSLIMSDDVSGEFYDEDLLAVQAMSDEDVAAELAGLGYNDTVVAENIAVCTNEKIILFPDPKAPQREREARLQSTLINALVQEALFKTASLTKKPNSTEYSQQVVDTYKINTPDTGSKVTYVRPANDHPNEVPTPSGATEKKLLFYKSAFGIAASLLMAVTTFSTVPSMLTSTSVEPDKFALPVNQWVAADRDLSHGLPSGLISQKMTPFGFITTAIRKQSPVYVPRTILEIGPSIDFLDRLNSGEIPASDLEKIRISRILQELATENVLSMKRQGLEYQSSNTCLATGIYEHVVGPGDTLSGIIDSCAYRVGNSNIFDVKQVLNINDIIIVHINTERMITKIDIDRINGTSSNIYSLDNS